MLLSSIDWLIIGAFFIISLLIGLYASKTSGKSFTEYFLAGGKEGGNPTFEGISKTAKDMNTMIELLKSGGFPAQNINSKIEPEGKHNEKLWKNSFEEAITWLFKL